MPEADRPTQEEVERVAKGLTKAQRDKLLWLPSDGAAIEHEKGSEVSLYCMSKILSGDPEQEIATIAVLCKQAGRAEPTKRNMWGNTLWRATPLGLAVRAHLTQGATHER